jgi:hypothetical protein
MNQLKPTANKLEELKASRHPLPTVAFEGFLDRVEKSIRLLADISEQVNASRDADNLKH